MHKRLVFSVGILTFTQSTSNNFFKHSIPHFLAILLTRSMSYLLKQPQTSLPSLCLVLEKKTNMLKKINVFIFDFTMKIL